jgi:hypothetical protein
MRRLVACTLLAVGLVLPLLQAQTGSMPAIVPPSTSGRTFGDGGAPVFAEFEVPGDGASEPTIGIPWNTDSLFYFPVDHALQDATGGPGQRVLRATFDATGKATWVDVSPPDLLPINIDPMLVADPDTGRVFAGGLEGVCSSMVYTDDDGATWLPTINMCSGKSFDHQSIGLGPPAGAIPSPEGTHVGYYCAQGGVISCARSVDEGSTWLPFQDVPGTCGGFHGHIQVSPLTGFVIVPTAKCGDHDGFIATADGGLTWTSHEVPGSPKWSNGFDPSAQFSRPSGWLYYAMASEHGVHVALSKDEGKTWAPLGAGMGVAPTTWLDLGQFHDPPIVSGVFTNVQAGDDDRVAVAFLGLEAKPGADTKFLTSDQIYQCDERQDELVWHQYVATSLDAGSTWSVARVSDDPVQVGGVFDSVVNSTSGACRNLLDFNDMDIDSHGRIHLGIADGCTQACATDAKPGGAGYRDSAPRVFRQIAGRGLFAAADLPGSTVSSTQSSSSPAPNQNSPGPAIGLVALALGGALLAARRR